MKTLTFYTLLFALVLVETPAHAYLDPGAGHVVWQYILSVLLGGVFFWQANVVWHQRALPSKTEAPDSRGRKYPLPSRSSPVKMML